MARVVVDESTGCWLYQGSPSARYPQIRVDGRLQKVHRIMYEADVGSIPDGLTLDHVRERGCTSTRCVNPAHLEPTTRAENTMRGEGPPAQNARKTHCVNGHPFDDDNTYRHRMGRGCRLCQRERTRKWRASRVS